jgi:hypothetical protein
VLRPSLTKTPLRFGALYAGVMCSRNLMYHQYFEDWEVKPDFKKEFISLWSGWLGEGNLHKLDEVTENEWQRFNRLLVLLSQDYPLQEAFCAKEKLVPIGNISSALSSYDSYDEAMNKDASKFSKFVIPDLDCVITEEWDYTYIIWYKDEQAITKLAPYIKAANLCHFS